MNKSLPKLKKALEIHFNKYIRLRDSGGGYFTCIACQMTKSTDDCDAGHYYAKNGYDGLRFDEDNVHAECSACNRFDDSHLIGYGVGISNKLGEQALQDLHNRAMDYKMNGYKWGRAELEEMILEYKLKIKDLG